jgi:predicted Zn-dependent peptidase
MAFKGTTTRSARAIAEEIEAVGGDLNAATSLENTAYYARLLSEDMPLALDILSDIVLNPRFDPAEFKRERDVILQEIASTIDSPEDSVFDLAQEAAFPGQATGRPILGTAATVRALKPQRMRQWLDGHYVAPATILCAAGDVDHAAFLREAERRFAGLGGTAAPEAPTASYVGGIRRLSRPFEQTHIVLCWEGLSYLDPDYYALQVATNIIGGGMSSRLFQEVREKRGLCYSVYSFAWGMDDTGLFGVHTAVSKERATQALEVIHQELTEVADKGVTQPELQRAKAQMKVGLLMSLESSSARAEQLARQLAVFGRPLSTEELIEAVDAVDADRVRAVSQRIFTASAPTLATAGPIKNLSRFDAAAAKLGCPASEAA